MVLPAHDREAGLANIAMLATLLLAALLEAGGDALVRSGLHGATMQARVGFMAMGAVVLFAYGVTVNLPPWDFGRLLGVYVALFFIVAQLINWFAFGLRPTAPILVGGALIVAGGLTITFWRA
jgi:drug/metabolite transporter superfamily protein YnfA